MGALEAAVSALKSGDVIAYPTEAVWGLGADPWNEQAVNEVFRLKARPKEKGLILIASQYSHFEPLIVSLTDEQKQHLQASWPGPFTWILPDPNNWVPQGVKGVNQSIAVRVSAHPKVKALCDLYGGPIVSTSANPAGELEARSEEQAKQYFYPSVSVYLPGEVDLNAQPSTIRDIVTLKQIR